MGMPRSIIKRKNLSNPATWQRHDRCFPGALLAVLFVLQFILISAGPAQAESLFDALSSAYEFNPALRAERARQKADQEQIRQAHAGWQPTISASGDLGEERTDRRFPRSVSNVDPSRIGISLSQPIFRGFRTYNEIRRARALVDAGFEQLLSVEQSLLLEVVTAYADVLSNRKLVRFRRANLDFLGDETRITKERYQSGDLTRTDVDQSESRLFLGRADLASAQAELAASEATYGSLVGHLPGRLTSPFSVVHLLPKNLNQAIDQAKENSPLLNSARSRTSAAAREVDVIRGELLPTVSFDASLEAEYKASEGIDKETTETLQFRFNVPIYSAGTTYSRIRQARAILLQRQQEEINFGSEIQAAVISSWKRRTASLRRVELARRGETSAQATLKGIRAQHEAGERTITDILDAQRDLVTAQVERTLTERDVIVDTFTLLAAIGDLSAQKLGLEERGYGETHDVDRHAMKLTGGHGKRPNGFSDKGKAKRQSSAAASQTGKIEIAEPPLPMRKSRTVAVLNQGKSVAAKGEQAKHETQGTAQKKVRPTLKASAKTANDWSAGMETAKSESRQRDFNTSVVRH